MDNLKYYTYWTVFALAEIVQGIVRLVTLNHVKVRLTEKLLFKYYKFSEWGEQQMER